MKRCFYTHLSLGEASCKRIVARLALRGQMWLWHTCLKNHPNKQTSPRLQCFQNRFGLLNNQRAEESHEFNPNQTCPVTKLPNVYSLLDLFTWLIFFTSLNKNRWPNFPLQDFVGMLATGTGGNSILWPRPVVKIWMRRRENVRRSTDR